MTTPRSSSRYPAEFLAAFQAAQTRGAFTIPTEFPRALQARLWGFARALRAEGQAPLADSIQITTSSAAVTLTHRSTLPEAQEIAAALSSLGDHSPESTLDRLFGRETDPPPSIEELPK
jgi:hypothetical protein